MKVYELFNKCNRFELYNTIKNEKNVRALPLDKFMSRLDELLSLQNPEATSAYHLVMTPYVSTNGTRADKDLFLLNTIEVNRTMSGKYTPREILFLTNRKTCGEVSLSDLINSIVCELSVKTFTPLQICSEIFIEVAVDVSDIQDYTRQDAIRFIKKIKAQLKGNHKTEMTDEEIETVISQNIVFAYPYYASVSNDNIS